MHITVRGWSRDLGKTEIMNADLADAESPPDRYSRDHVYKTVEFPNSPSMTKVSISTSAELRLGGTYLLNVELSRKEIAQLFFDTHSGAMVRMIQSIIQEEDREDRARLRERIAQYQEHRRQRLAAKEEQVEKSAPLD